MTDDPPREWPEGDDSTATSEDLAEISTRIDRVAADIEALQKLGEEHDLPAVERTAKRIEGTLSTLDSNVPPELTDGDESPE